MTCADTETKVMKDIIDSVLEFKDKHLTRAEFKVLYDAYTTPRTNNELAAGLGMSVNTVKTHLRHIYSKFGVGSRMQLKHKLDDLFMT